MERRLVWIVALFAALACNPVACSLSTSEPVTDERRPDARPDGALRLTTPPPGASDQNPAFSPDGSRLVFTRFENGYNQGPAALFLLNLSNGEVARLTPPGDQDNVNLPGAAWDAVGDRIVFASDRIEADDLWWVAPGSGVFNRVTVHDGLPRYVEPSWSPDGEWIVFEADDDVPGGGRQGSIWKVRADGAGLTRLTDGPGSGCDDRQPNWSPAGDRILFQRRVPGSDDWDLYTMATDGSDVRRVTAAPSCETDASWSPDGRWIIYSSDDGGLSASNLFVVPAAGGVPIRITYDDDREDSAPSWSPDGRWIAFESHEVQDEESPASLWRIAVPSLLASSGGEALPEILTGVDDFVYQLQEIDLQAIGDTAYDLVVIDYSADGSDEAAFTAAQIAALRRSPGGDKIVLAYMSIGEAEDYRFYWQDGWTPGDPPWLDEENPDWEGNYRVRYWDPAWQAIVFDYTDRLLDAGFDGAYLDLVDAYAYYADQGRVTAAQEMADFVAAIRAYARRRDPDFLIFPQNAPELAALAPGYLDSVDGIGQEDLYYGYEDDDVMTPLEVTARLEAYLDLFRDAGKLVLTIDYADAPAHVGDAYTRSRARGYVPYVTRRDLDILMIHSGYEPD